MSPSRGAVIVLASPASGDAWRITVRPLVASAASLLLLATVGAGAASADPINGHSRYFSANCEGEILDFVTTNGASAHVLSDSRVAVNMGTTMDGEWIIPLPPGQSKADLVECVYTQLFDGHQFVIYVKL
jgi:hypothetical protein